jgi:hypothetical protein
MSAITDYITEYNKEANYEIIFTQNGGIGTILLAGSAYNISSEVLADLNEQYTSSK